jgi:hypothetical protein
LWQGSRLEKGPGWAHIPMMGQSFGSKIQLVEATSDDNVRGLAKKKLWVAIAEPNVALALVLAEIPEGWSAALTEEALRADEVVTVLKMKPGEVRELPR